MTDALDDPRCSIPPKVNSQYHVGLWLVDGCNLKCTYCYQDRYKPHVVMTQAVLGHTIDFLNKLNPGGLSFFGGEPLLNQDSMKQILAKTDIKRYYLTTNGTLLNDDIFDWLEYHKVYINLSLDGTKQTQDEWRSNSYNRIMDNLPRILRHFKTVGGNVLCANVMESRLYENISHIKSLGFPSVYINQLDGYSTTVKNEISKIGVFKDQYRKIIELDGDDFEVADLRRWKSFLQPTKDNPRKNLGSCGYNHYGLGISPTGLLYACHRGPELLEHLSFGDVWNGISLDREKEVRSMAIIPPMCDTCELHFSQCHVSCYQNHQKFGVDPHQNHCLYEKAKGDVIREFLDIQLSTDSDVRLIVGTLIDPHKYYVLPIFLRNLVRMRFPADTDYYFVTDADDHSTRKFLDTWRDRRFAESIPYRDDLVNVFRTIRIPVFSDDSKMDRITRGRDLLLNEALRGNYTHLMWLDSDIIAPHDTISDLLALDSPIAGALVRTRDERTRKTWYNTYIDKRAEGGGFPSKTDFKRGDIIDVDATGCDCVLITRQTLQAVGCYEWQSDPPVGEDMGFCLKAKEKGLGVKIHTGVKTRHLGVQDISVIKLKGRDVIGER